MKDSKKLITIIVLIIVFIVIYLFQDEVAGFFKNPLESLKPKIIKEKIEENNESKDKNVKVVYVEEEQATIDVIKEASPAVVSVVRKEVYFDPFRGPFKSEDSIGTGFIVDGEKGIVLTNKHVVDSDEATYSVIIGTGEESYDVLKVYRDPINDFAILKIDNKGVKLPELELGDSDKLQVGQTVVAIGNALGQFGNSATKGIVSGLKRGIIAQSGPFGPAESLENIIQTDAALNPGNSGGPLLDLQSKVVGINVAISQGAENIGFSIPINTLKNVIDQFYETGKISRPYLGVEYAQITKEIAEQRALPVGAFVRKIVPESPAEKAGIEPGDIILSINGVRLDDENNTLAKVVSQQKAGEEIEILIDRNGKESTLKATLEDLEE